MLPSIGRRVVVIIGLLSGLGAFLLEGWSRVGLTNSAFGALAFICVVSLFVSRRMPARRFDDNQLRAEVGDDPVKRLTLLQNLALILMPFCVGTAAVSMAPTSVSARHVFVVIATALLLVWLAIGLYVETTYRKLLKQAGMI